MIKMFIFGFLAGIVFVVTLLIIFLNSGPDDVPDLSDARVTFTDGTPPAGEVRTKGPEEISGDSQ